MQLDRAKIHSSKPLQSGRRRRAGYILVLVLGLTAVATSLGLAFLDANSTVMPEAMNYNGTIRAQFMAGSGVALAAHYLMYLPTSVALSSYWTGANNVNLGVANEYFNVGVVRSDGWTPAKTDPFLYRITSTGVVNDPNGSTRAKKSVTADVIAVPRGTWVIRQALVTNATYISRSVERINGDAHSNANLGGTGWSQGNLSAAGVCFWMGTGPPASQTSSVAAVSPLPAATVAPYSTYTIQGKTYTAYSVSWTSDISQADADTINAINMSATNPGRVLLLKNGNNKVRINANLNGTVVADGDFELDDAGPRSITAMPGFPALIVTKDIKVLNDDCVFTVNGAVISSGAIDNNNKDRTIFTFNGPVIGHTGAVSTKSTIVINYNYTASRATFWDFEGTSPLRPITLLNWKEN